ncbi:MAG TPA: MMPL family transporter [Actinomycetes bacterium]|nr:MMPL family transporter [Actinomycetes bacterium]
MTGLMAGVGRFCARHAWWVMAGWVLVAVIVGAAVNLVGAQTDNDLDLPGTGSQRATDVLAKRFPPQQNGTSPIVFYTPEGRLTSGDHKAAVKDAVVAMRHVDHVYSVLNPVSSKGQEAGLVSQDGATAYAPVLLDIDSGLVDEQLASEILDAARGAAEPAGIQVEAGGSIGSRLSTPATESSELVGLTAAMIILTVVLGSLVAMGLPIIVAIVALSCALSVIGLLGHLIGVPSIAPTVATMIGLGVGIDYALFLVTRHKDQLNAGSSIRDSIAHAVATSGSAIVFAGGTVIIALLCLGVASIPLVTSIGLASVVAVVIAVLGAVTLLPALLSVVGGGIYRLSLPHWLQRRPAQGRSAFWTRWAEGVTGHPWLAIVGALVLLVPPIIPVFSLELGQEDIAVTPTSTTERRAYDLVKDGLGVGYNGPLLIATTLKPPAHASAQFTRQYQEAKTLKRELKREQKSLLAQKKSLERQQRSLEAQADVLQAKGDDLQQQEADLLAQRAALEAEASALENQKAELLQEKRTLLAEKRELKREARQLAKEAVRVAAALVVVRVREAVLEERIDNATNPDRIRRLEERLDRVQAREADLQRRADQLKREGMRLVDKAERLENQRDTLKQRGAALKRQARALRASKRELTAQGEALQAQAADLQAQQSELEAQSQQLQREADQLKRQKQKAQQQKKHAERLQNKLTNELTAAGGDKRATDPRVVALQDQLLATPGVKALTPPQMSANGDALVINAVPHTAPASDATAALVEYLRADVLPQNTDEGLRSYVGGYTASYVDLASKISQRLLLVVGVVLALSFLLLLLAFRSLLVPVQAAIANLLSVAASFGVLTATFQWGWGLSLVGLDAPGGTVPIASYVPLMMFAILFGLSMDYEVFLVSHIIAARDHGIPARPAVSHGLADSARVISAAALIMICVFGSFILNGDPTVKQFGVGLSVAVFLAAALVLVLAPALLTLFGRATWQLPRWLDRLLPDLGIGE